MNEALNEKYREILISPVRECATYSPKFGHGRGKGLSLASFLKYVKDIKVRIQNVKTLILRMLQKLKIDPLV